MNDYLVTFSVGPVQGFIASARRSRDLWSGSYLLSELSKACAKNLKDNGATLIFPHITDDKDLQKNSPFSVGNKIQAIIKADNNDTLKQIITHATTATHARFSDEVNFAKDTLKNFDNQLRNEIWKKQTADDYIEMQVAWAKIGEDKDGKTGYQTAVQKVGRVLASRKATRYFSPSALSPYDSQFMLPKSSLDGARETVLQEDNIKDGLRKKLGLSKSEQLDVAGIVKRLGFGEVAEQFTPISRVMADAWIAELASKESNELKKLGEIYNDLVRQEVATRVRGNDGIYNDFAYDAQLLYPSRLEVAIKEWQGVDDAVGDNLKALKNTLRPLYKKYGEPYRYGVLLLADGDRMGELLDKATTQDEHQAITQALSNFAGKVAQTMRASRGHCIYAGGDDVLGFVPLDKAYQCADSLQKLFAESLAKVAEQLGVDKAPTLSVGLAICHILTPLSVMRELASGAEKYAKGDHVDEKQSSEKEGSEKRRNALGILLSVRSGNDTKLRFNWDDVDALADFNTFVNWYVNKTIPSRVAYDVRAIGLCMQGVSDDKERQKNIESAEMKRVLEQARTDKGDKIAQDVIKKLIERGKKVGLSKLSDELIVARWLAAKTQKDLGKE